MANRHQNQKLGLNFTSLLLAQWGRDRLNRIIFVQKEDYFTEYVAGEKKMHGFKQSQTGLLLLPLLLLI